MRCCILDECHGEGGDTNSYGTAMGSSDSDDTLEDITFFKCWKQEFPFTDRVYGLLRGTVDSKGINSSKCISRGGGLIGYYGLVESGAKIRYIQGVEGEEANALTVGYSSQTAQYVNVINNSFISCFMYGAGVTLTLQKGCFFLNNKYNNAGTVYAFDCISDSYQGAVTKVPFSLIEFDVQKCRMSIRFTLREQKRLFPSHLIFIFIGN